MMSPHLSRPRTAMALAAFLFAAGPVLAQDDVLEGLDVPYVPTPPEVVQRMLQMGEVSADDYVVDLGSGDGRIAIAAARDYGARAYGVDINPVRVEEAEANAREAGVQDRVSFAVQDLFDTPIAEVDVLTMYLLPRVNLQVRPRILEEMRPGTRVVSHAFDMDDWEPDASDTVMSRNIYLWIVPAKVDGAWTVKSGEASFTVNIAQTFQKIEGTASINGNDVPLTDTALRGDQIRFSVDAGEGAQSFSGRVSGDTIEAVAEDGTVAEWSATRG